MRWLERDHVVVGAAEEEMMQTYKVGGYVRDRILGRDSSDVDHVVVGASEEEMIQN